MRIVYGDIWTVQADFRGITTNGTVKKNGCVVMGRGVALQARDKYPGIDCELGQRILNEGNHVHMLRGEVFSFPVKRDWWEPASIGLIKQSVGELTILAQWFPKAVFAIPMPGTGNGHLAPEIVWPLLQGLPNNVMIVMWSDGI